ncbi:hypothetical protein BDZ90DRAFT_234038 [Jaminaea rosea]|uniref:Uncharacterized protein n=1 Tax=Jaminaea rosea TaxID=1569628 RepID=A0A316ULC1_9BASI|nr:hypothetical protein BDZ90DRAFT_234038 [Jaminaea rosea]PWN25598.1 hypothetical protein BDZ90DRAFT_234038 [Jaminaea rosea]
MNDSQVIQCEGRDSTAMVKHEELTAVMVTKMQQNSKAARSNLPTFRMKMMDYDACLTGKWKGEERTRVVLYNHSLKTEAEAAETATFFSLKVFFDAACIPPGFRRPLRAMYLAWMPFSALLTTLSICIRTLRNMPPRLLARSYSSSCATIVTAHLLHKSQRAS